MSIDSRIIGAIRPIITEVKPNIYMGSAKEYCVYSYTELPTVHADSKPNVLRYMIQVNYYLPNESNPNSKKQLISNALLNAGFTYPSIINASDKEGQHYVFECEAIEGKSYA